MKNIEWLRKELVRREDNFVKLVENEQGVDYNSGKQVATRQAINLIDELDDPETLSQKWIENHTASAYTIAHYSEEDVPVVMASDLKGLLIANEPNPPNSTGLELPVIPAHVAEHIEVRKAGGDTLAQGYNISTYREVGEWLLDKDNCELFASAWINGYTVEEKKYMVAIDHDDGDWTYASDGRYSFETTDESKANELAKLLGGRVIAEEVTE